MPYAHICLKFLCRLPDRSYVKRIFIISMFLFSFFAVARQPAVLPGRTISTAQYDKNLPKADNFQGYKFTNTPNKSAPPITDNLNRLSKAGPQSISIYLTIFALLFPFGLWLINNRSLKDENDLINKNLESDTEQPQIDNVIELGFNNDELTETMDKDSSDDEEERSKKAS